MPRDGAYIALMITPSFLAALSVVFAIWVPQNRSEFVEAVAAGKGATKMETLTVGRSLDQVFATLEEKSAECLDVLVERTGYVGYVEVSSSDYNPTLERTGEDSAAFTLQVEHRPRGVGHQPPQGGLYVMAADLKAVDAGRTEVVLYRPTIGFKTISTSFKAWLEGSDDDCPKMR